MNCREGRIILVADKYDLPDKEGSKKKLILIALEKIISIEMM